MATSSLRPGVYSQYTIVPTAGRRVSVGEALVVATGGGEESGRLDSHSSLTDLQSWENYNAASPCHRAAAVLLAQGAAAVHTVTVGESWEEAFLLGEALDSVEAIVTDCPDAQLIKKQVEQKELPGQRRARIAYWGGEELTSTLEMAQNLSDGRCCVCYPPMGVDGEIKGIYTAAAFAAKVLTLDSPAYTLSWTELEGVESVASPSAEETEELIAGGVTPFENRQGVMECVRAVTAAPKDSAVKNLNTVLIIDDVLTYLGENLTLLLKNSRGLPLSTDAIASQAAVLLAEKQDEGLVTEFETPVARASADDPAVCLLTAGFQAATVTEIIRLTAAIRM